MLWQGEVLKEEIQVVEMVWSSFDLSKSSEEEEEENLDHVNIPQKPIVRKRLEKESDEAQEARFHHKANEILQLAKGRFWNKMSQG